MGSRRFRALLPLAVGLLLLGAPGCWNPFNPEGEDTGGGGGAVKYDRTTRVNLVEFFAKAHEDRDIEAYKECLHRDYKFWFWEEDISNPDWQWSEWIQKKDDVDVTENMFGAENVTSILVEFNNQTVVQGATEDEDRFWADVVEIGGEVDTVYGANFLVDMRVTEDQGELRLEHWVDGRAHIFLLPDPQFEGLWTIWKIDDRGNRDPGG